MPVEAKGGFSANVFCDTIVSDDNGYKKGGLSVEKIMAINSGSSSLKFKLFAMPAEEELAAGHIERIGIAGSRVTIKNQAG